MSSVRDEIKDLLNLTNPNNPDAPQTPAALIGTCVVEISEAVVAVHDSYTGDYEAFVEEAAQAAGDIFDEWFEPIDIPGVPDNAEPLIDSMLRHQLQSLVRGAVTRIG